MAAIVSLTDPKMVMSPSIFRCPNEILCIVLQQLDLPDLHSFSLVSRKCFSIVDDSLLWKLYCCRFQYWKGGNAPWLQDKELSVNWKTIAIERWLVNKNVEQKFEALILAANNEHYLLSHIAWHGYNAKDFLLEQRQMHDDNPEVLCRRWWAQQSLNVIHRWDVLDEWSKTMLSEPPSRTELGQGYQKHRLERLIRVLGLAILHQPEDETDSLSWRLSNMTRDFLQQHPRCMRDSNCDRAMLLLRWFNKLATVNTAQAGNQPKELGISYAGQAPFGQKQKIMKPGPNLTLVRFLAAIFVAVAQRLNIPAYFSLTSESIIVPHTDNDLNNCDTTASRRQTSTKPLLLRPGISYDSQAASASTNDSDFRAMTEDEFILKLLDSFLTQLKSDKRGASFANEVESATQHMKSCAELLLMPLMTSTSLLDEYLDPSGIFICEDAWSIDDHLSQWLHNRAPSGYANSIPVRCVRQQLAMLKHSFTMSGLGDLLDIWKAEGHHHSAYQIGDVVRIPWSYYCGLAITPSVNVAAFPRSGAIGVIVNIFLSELPVSATDNDFDDLICECLVSTHDWNFPFSLPATHEFMMIKCGDPMLERVKNPALVSKELCYHAGEYAQRFDAANCKFVLNVPRQFPED